MSKPNKKLTAADIDHEENKIRGLTNGVQAKHVYFLSNIRERELNIDAEQHRFDNGIKDMKKRISQAKKRRKQAEKTLEAYQDQHTELLMDISNGRFCLVYVKAICNIHFLQIGRL